MSLAKIATGSFVKMIDPRIERRCKVSRPRGFGVAVALVLSLSFPAVAVTPLSVSVTPNSGSGSSQTFTLRYADGDGYGDIASAFVLVNDGSSLPGGCATYYDSPNHAIYLANDAGEMWSGPHVVGQAGQVSNSQCILDVGASSVLKTGNELTVNLDLTFLPEFAGSKTVSMKVIDNGNLTADWEERGTWTVPIMEDWPKFRRDLANSGRSLETSIDSNNASMLERRWKFTVDTFGGDRKVSASPAVATVGGVRTVYIGAWSGFFYAINAETGAEIWRFEVDRTSAEGATNCTTTSRCRIASSAAVDNDVVYFGAENAYLYALNAVDGSLIWKRQLGDPQDGAEIWSSPAVHNGLVYVGLASHNSAPCVAGKMFALDAFSGAPAWEFDAVVQDTCPSGVCRGAGIWSSPAIDTEFGTIFIGTGNPGNSCSPATAKATEEYSDGILGLSLASGTLKSFHRTRAIDTTDSGDVGAAPVLHEIESVDGCTDMTTTTSWLTVPSKDHQVWTGERDATGMMTATPLSLDDLARSIATPALIPYSETQPCEGGELTLSSNDIFQPTSNGNLYKIRQASDGTTAQMDKFPINVSGGCATPHACPLFSAPASVTDMLFFGGGEGNFYGYKGDGTRIFSYGTLGLVASGPALSGGRIYFGSYDGNVYCLSVGSAPTISGIDPATGSTIGGQSVTITGSNLESVTSVTFDGTAAALSSNTNTTVVVLTPSKPAGISTVTVTTASGSADTVYTFVAPPAIAGIDPGVGLVTGGETVTITGSNFVDGAAVAFGESAASSVTVTSSTTIEAITPAHEAGPVDVVVTNPDGQSGTLGNGFSFHLPNGDANGNGAVGVDDIFYLINHLFAGGPGPIGDGDANGDGEVNVADIFYLINHLFAGGPPPP